MNPYGQAFVATPGHADNFTLQLLVPPIKELGPVSVYFMLDGETCTDCIAFEDINGDPLEMLHFTYETWNVPILVRVVYLAEGETFFYVVGYGGGYEIPHWQCLFTSEGARTVSQGSRALTCAEGQAGFGCN